MINSIIETLDARGLNRGLYFSPDMRLLCGQRRRVRGRIDKIIVDGTGKMRQLRNTVCLEEATCGCDYMGFGMGGCSRCGGHLLAGDLASPSQCVLTSPEVRESLVAP